MAWAVHWLQSEFLFLALELKHVFTVMLPVAGGLPQFSVVNVGCDNFLEAALPVFGTNKVNELIVNKCSFWIEKATAWTELMEKKQLLFLCYLKNFL